MQRDYGSYFQDKLNWWFVAGQFYYYKDPIHGLAVTFAPVLYDIIDFLYNEESDSFYDTLHLLHDKYFLSPYKDPLY